MSWTRRTWASAFVVLVVVGAAVGMRSLTDEAADVAPVAAIDPAATPPPPPTAEELRRAGFVNAAQHLGDGFEVPAKAPYRLTLTPGSPAAAGLPGTYRVEVVREVVVGVPPYSRRNQNAALTQMCEPRTDGTVAFASCVETLADLGPGTGPDWPPTRSGPIVQVQHLDRVGTGSSAVGLRVFQVEPRQLTDARIVMFTLWALGPADATVAEQNSARAWVNACTPRLLAALQGQPTATWAPSAG